jgi:hypothetical protein
MRFRRSSPVSADEGAPGSPTDLVPTQCPAREKLPRRQRNYAHTQSRKPTEAEAQHAGRWPCGHPRRPLRQGPRARGKRAIP